jgi:hypothetical protein
VCASEIAIAPPPHGLAPIQFELVINLTTANRELLQDSGAQHPDAPLAVGAGLSPATTSKYVRDFKGGGSPLIGGGIPPIQNN